MPYDYVEYLRFAQKLATNDFASLSELPDAVKRNAASRAYYAALKCASDFVVRIDGEQISQVLTSHSAVWTHFEQKGRVRNKVWVHAKELQGWRTWADYDSNHPPPATLADIFESISELQAALIQICNGKKKDIDLCSFLSAECKL